METINSRTNDVELEYLINDFDVTSAIPANSTAARTAPPTATPALH